MHYITTYLYSVQAQVYDFFKERELSMRDQFSEKAKLLSSALFVHELGKQIQYLR